MNFWDTHDGLHPKVVVCNKFITEIDGTPYRGVFNAGIGEDTINGVKRGKKVVKHNYLGNVTYKATQFRFPDKLVWVIVTHADGTTWLHEPVLVDKNSCSSYYSVGDQMYNVTGWSDARILGNCQGDDGFNKVYFKNHVTDKLYGQRKACTNNWSVEFDGKNIFALAAVKTEMTYAEIRNVIMNEGGTIDENGTIHKGTARNIVYEVK